MKRKKKSAAKKTKQKKPYTSMRIFGFYFGGTIIHNPLLFTWCAQFTRITAIESNNHWDKKNLRRNRKKSVLKTNAKCSKTVL